jgi:hypothetical protein
MPRLLPRVGGILLLFLGLPEAEAQADLHCDSPVFNAGEARSGVPLRHRFVFVNVGPGVVQVSDVRTSCGCLTPRLGQRRYGPGEEGSLLLEVNTLTQPEGPHSWSAQVRYESGGHSRELSFLLYARVRTEVSVQPAALVLYTDTGIGHELTLSERRPRPLTVTAVETGRPEIRGLVEEPRPDGAGRWVRAVRLEVLPGCPEGRHEGMLSLYTSDPDYPELRVPLTVVKRPRNQVSATPGTVVLSGTAGQPLPARIVLLGSADDQDVEVDRVETDDPVVLCQWAKGPGRRTTLKVRVDHTRLSGPVFQGAVRVHLRRPAIQTLTVPIRCDLR